MQWISFEEACPNDMVEVLLIGMYPGSHGVCWTDIYHGWKENNLQAWTTVWARWPHKFPPTHWAKTSTPY